jgi:hypothetical protein
MPVPKKKRTRKPKSSSPKSSPASSLLAAGKSRRSMSSEAAGVVRHTHEPSQPFFLLHHPRNWRIVAEGLDAPAIVPDLQKLPLQPGVNGVRTRQPHEPESATYQRAVEELSRDGFSVLMPDEVIPADCLPDGLEGEGYLREYLCRGPISQRNGSHYVEVWSVPQPVYPGEVQRYKFDRSAYHRWLVHLVESGRVEAPTAEVREQLANRLGRRVDRAKAMPIPADLRGERVAEQAARVAEAEAATLPEEAAA